MARTSVIRAAFLIVLFAGYALGQPLGDVYSAGTTWSYPFTFGTVGRMLAVDDLGGAHIVWTNAFNPEESVRHAFYNVMVSGSQGFSFAYGQQIDVAQQAGYPNVTTFGEGWSFPAFQALRHGNYAGFRCCIGMDFLPGVAAFTGTYPAEPSESELPSFGWPKIVVSRDSILHMVSMDNPSGPVLPRVYYSRGHPTWDTEGYGLQVEWETLAWPFGYLPLDTARTFATNIACSRVSDRVAVVYGRECPDVSVTPPAMKVDLMLIVSEDGGLNWGPPVNLTRFSAGDTLHRDTLQLQGDCSVIFDGYDQVHLAFTTVIPDNPADSIRHPGRSGIWHWSETFDEFTPIADHYCCLDGPAGFLMPPLGGGYLQRPSLAIDHATGDLFCAYQRYMPGQWSSDNVPMADVIVSRSCNSGRVWSAGTNVTRTDGGQNTPAPNVLNEESPSLAEQITYEDGQPLLHLFYLMDQGPGLENAHNSLVDYQRIPADSIPLRPVQNPFWPPLHSDSSGYPAFSSADTVGERLCGLASAPHPDRPEPETFHLDQNYPNPFNAVTRISFRLERQARVTLTIYNVLGQAVSTLHDHALLQPGAHEMAFDAGRLSSGLYFCRLDAGTQSATIKMILLR